MREVSVFLKNVPGQLARLAETLSARKVNIRGIIVEESELFSFVRFACDDCEKAVSALKADFQVGTDEVLEVKISPKPGSLAKLAKILGTREINIEYCYVALSATGKSTVLVVRVNNPEKAKSELTAHGIHFT